MQEIENFKKLLKSPKKVVITTHRGPDGDAIGSSLACYHLLTKLGHQVQVITPNNYASFLHWMPGNEKVIQYNAEPEIAKEITKDAELIIMLDFNEIHRLENFANSINKSTAKKILIDHHEDPDINIADIIISDSNSCSTAQLLYEVIENMHMEDLITQNIAECLYTGIMTDTGSFKYESTEEKTHNIIAKLISKGANNTKIHQKVYDNFSPDRIKLLGYCLNKKLQLYLENKSAIISLTNEELKKFNFKKGDTEGIVNYALSIEGIIFACFIVERGNIVKLSLRSKGGLKVNEIAKQYFNGGGHINAAGGISETSVRKTIEKVEEIILSKKDELNKIKL
ncbi:MAG: bifunctional oligoribonuclease/PAP phosphatase NrnA [Bacteroidota bacterium]|nr:bifunctional oligoribonuclease/PAP phosphatase NrnA [Bacteroidota bacterium]